MRFSVSQKLQVLGGMARLLFAVVGLNPWLIAIGAAESTTTSKHTKQDSSIDEDEYGDRPGEAIWTRRHYTGPRMPNNPNSDYKIYRDEDGSKSVPIY